MRRRAFLRHALACGLSPVVFARPRKISIYQFSGLGSSLPDASLEEALPGILAAGFAGVEFDAWRQKNSRGGAQVDKMSADDQARLKVLLKRFRHLSTHLPFRDPDTLRDADFRPIAADAAIREKARHQLRRAIEDTAFWGVKMTTIHVCSEKGVAFSDAKPELVALYRELGDQAAKHHIRLGIEMTGPYRAAEYLDLVESVGRENVGGTVDTGHVGIFREDVGITNAERSTARGIQRYNEVLMDFVKGLGPKLFHFHVHDVRPSDWKDHFCPPTGVVDWMRLLKHLSSVGYTGWFAAEIINHLSPPDVELRQARAFFQKTLSQI